MDQLIYLYAALVVLAAGLAGITIRSHRSMAMRASAVILAGFLMVTGYAALTELLGRPKPTTLEWARRAAPAATVLAADMREGEAIWLWLRLDGEIEPRAFVLPWSMAAARQLHEATGEAKKQGTAVRMRKPFGSEPDGGERQFYAAPQPPLPPKTAQAS